MGFEGASGYVTFDQPDGSGKGERVSRDKLLLVVEVHGGRRTIHLLCGRLTETTAAGTWGPDDR